MRNFAPSSILLAFCLIANAAAWPSRALAAHPDILCDEAQRALTSLSHVEHGFAIGLFRGFIIGANAANSQLLNPDAWASFSVRLSRECQVSPSLRFMEALFRAFEKVHRR